MPGTNKVTLRVDWTFGFLLRLSQAELAPFMSEIPIQNQILKKGWLWNVFLQLETKTQILTFIGSWSFSFLGGTFFFLDSLLNNNHKLIQIIMPQLFWIKIVFCLFFHKLRECMSAVNQMRIKSHKMSENLARSLWQLYSRFNAST